MCCSEQRGGVHIHLNENSAPLFGIAMPRVLFVASLNLQSKDVQVLVMRLLKITHIPELHA